MKPGVITEHALDVAPLSQELLRSVCEKAFLEVQHQDELARKGRFGGTHILPSGPNVARLAVLTEEVGEVAKECNEEIMDRAGWTQANLITELVQVAACAIAWATALEDGR